ncbi:MAG: histidinol-phosphate transaminase [Verrucomicrobiota bacterium]|nr:histidinol-phosphate transaminase [Verrucomicrobiota bacterium]
MDRTRFSMNAWIRKSVRMLTPYTPGEQPKRPDRVIKLNTNENPYPPSPQVARAWREFDPRLLRLYPDPLCGRIRARIARLHRCDPAQVFVGNGGDEILMLCSRAFAEDGGSVGYFDPSYSLYPVLADIRGLKKKPVELGPDYDWRMPSGYRASVFFLTTPNAPTGIQYPRAVVEAFCRTFPGVVVLDEAYVDFARDNYMDLALCRDNALVLRSLSKSYSLAGLRVGYAVGPRPLIGALFKIKDSYNLDRLSQALALAALSDVAHMRRNTRKIVATRERLARTLLDMGCAVYPSDSNFLWVRPAGISAATLFRRLRERRIMIRYFAGRRTGRCVRITVGTDAETDAMIQAWKGLTA